MEDVHKVEGPRELGRVDTTESELAVRGFEARRGGERNPDFVCVDKALRKCVVGDRRDARRRVGEKGACKHEGDESPTQTLSTWHA